MCLYVGVLDVVNTIKLWNRLFEEGDIALTRCTMSLLYQVRSEIQEEKIITLFHKLWVKELDLDLDYEYFQAYITI